MYFHKNEPIETNNFSICPEILLQYVGWKCDEPWHFYQLHVIEHDRDSSKVLVVYPDADELAESREKAQQKKLYEAMKAKGQQQIGFASTVLEQNTSGFMVFCVFFQLFTVNEKLDLSTILKGLS